MSRPLTRRPPRLAAWAAILTIALHALWPLIAEAKPRSVVLVPLCTVGGETHYQELPGGTSPIEQHSAAHQEHCVCCSLALPTSPSIVFHPEQAAATTIAALESVFLDTEKLLPGRPRAPPSFLSMKADNDNDRSDHEEDSSLRLRGARAGDADGGAGELRLGVLHH